MNQVTSSCYAASKINKPFLGIYSACASNVEGLIIGSNFINSGIINNCLCGTSSHNMSSENNLEILPNMVHLNLKQLPLQQQVERVL